MRILKKEVMVFEQEAYDYDLVVSKYIGIIHAGFAETVINLSPAEGRFLDIGTGTGWDAILIAKNSSDVQVTAVDLSDAMLELASRNARKERVDNKIDFIKGDAKALPFNDRIFDAVFCQNMLHHLPEPGKMLAEIKRVVKSDGAIIIRDLVRHTKPMDEFCVNVLGINFNGLMKIEYRRSISAAFTEQEWMGLMNKMEVPGLRLTKQFLTHASIERPSPRRRGDYIRVVKPFYRRIGASLYISKP